MSDAIVFYHNPLSRGRRIRWMLEEVGAPYETRVLDLAKGEHKAPEYLAINPMGKIPAIVHRNVVVTECDAICAYLADAFPEAHLAPARDDPQRGSYYRWMFFDSGCLEPAFSDRLLERPPVERKSALGYGSYEDTVAALHKALEPGPFILGDAFSAADVCIGSALGFALMRKALAPTPPISAYVGRCMGRPAAKRAAELDNALLPRD